MCLKWSDLSYLMEVPDFGVRILQFNREGLSLQQTVLLCSTGSVTPKVICFDYKS